MTPGETHGRAGLAAIIQGVTSQGSSDHLHTIGLGVLAAMAGVTVIVVAYAKGQAEDELTTLAIAGVIGSCALALYWFFGGRFLGPRLGRAADALRRRRAAAVARKVAETDPDFDADAFAARVLVAFDAVQRAWDEEDLAPIRPFVSDGLYERATLQILELREHEEPIHTARLIGMHAALASLERTALVDVLTMSVWARPVARRHAKGLNIHRAHLRSVGTCEEYWTFLRRRGVRTGEQREGVLEGHCPNCGAGVALNQWAHCEHCQAQLRSGEHDWVLVEITSERRWDEPPADGLPGVAELRSRDPEFTVSHLEDRAAVTFWRRRLAEREGRTGGLRRLVTNELLETWQRGYDQRPPRDRVRSYAGTCGLEGVQTRGILPGGSHDTAIVELRWSGGLGASGHKAALAADPAEQEGWETLYVFRRRADARSDVRHVLSSAHCPGCGAPDRGAPTETCEYCDSPLADETRDWTLAEIIDAGTPRAGELLESLPAPADAEAEGKAERKATASPGSIEYRVRERVYLLAWLMHVAMADGKLATEEFDRLGLLRRYHLSPMSLLRVRRLATRGDLLCPRPRTEAEGRAWFEACVHMALRDGALSREELVVLDRLGTACGLGRGDVRRHVRATMKGLRAEAREILRGA